MFDNRTLLIEGLLIPLSFMVILFIEFGWSKKQGVKSNILANLFHFLACMLFLMRNYLTGFFTFGLSHTFIMISSIMIIATTFTLFDVEKKLKRYIYIGLTIFLTMNFFVFIVDSIPMRYLSLSIGVSAIYVYGILHLIFRTSKKDRALLPTFIIEFIIISIASMSRILFFNSHHDILENNLASSLYILSATLFILLWNYTVQLKRNSIFQSTIEKNSEEIYRIQEDLSILNNTYFETSSAYSLDELYHNIFELINERFLINKAIIFIFDDDDLVPVHSMGFLGSEIDTIHNLNSETNLNKKAYSEMIISEVYAGELDPCDFRSLILNSGFLGAVAFPLYTDGSRIGSLFVGITPNSTIINKDRDIFLSICRQISGVIYGAQMHNKLLESQKKLKLMASTDHLTGIYNRREFFIQFRGEFNSALRHHDIFTLFMVDLDDFKLVNDTYGHDAGDLVLIKVVQLIRHNLRINDLFARYGGEEFVGVLLRSDNEGASRKLNKIIENVSKIRIPAYPKIKITISIGSCSYNDGFENIETMIKRADIELYKAKKNGKNQLCSE